MAFSTSRKYGTNTVLVTDGNGEITATNISRGELEYLDGASSSIQTQINAKATTTQLSTKPTIKCVILKGLFPNTTSDFTRTHNIPNGSTVLGFCIGVQYSGTADVTSRLAMPPNFTDSGAFHYQAYISDTSLTVRQMNSSELQGMPYKCVIWYD